MINRAKCLLCHDIIQSMSVSESVTCSCGEISVFDGDAMRCAAKRWSSFARVDDSGDVLMPTIRSQSRLEELTDELGRLAKVYDEMPAQALQMSVSHYDLASALQLIHAILEEVKAAL